MVPNGYTSKRPGPYWSNPPFKVRNRCVNATSPQLVTESVFGIVSEMIYYVSSGTLNPAHSLTRRRSIENKRQFKIQTKPVKIQ